MTYEEFLELNDNHIDILLQVMSSRLIENSFNEEFINLKILGKLNEIGIYTEDVICDYTKDGLFCELKINSNNINFNILLSELISFGFMKYRDYRLINGFFSSEIEKEFNFNCTKRCKQLLKFHLINNNILTDELVESLEESINYMLDHIFDTIKVEIEEEKNRLSTNREVIFNLYNESFGDIDKLYESEVDEFAKS